ncbi:zinc ribbon domain-containing protein [Microbacterium thalli]|uniref:C4-type zinc ribbon domain-containing protein n=1 Tax=Microbacterium thalli TaxID=3027921 RepID=A0ABT5SI97_9MICO|nr:C4-type zinc ribbon domain-containing protein [Microbacterium thalli]MDD7930040.1 C4-type zinc ribbon domain-containing protein [Microbacterium thalli]MDD7962502.1 C4-type zinc ribbon domain-containing protein [Microbacterium thalli]MDN8548730.1 C4-type zinc ribbon domain-containing protein [Microbacterium thalli]
MNATPADQLLLLDLVRLDAQARGAEAAMRNPAQAKRVQELLARRHELSVELTGLLGTRDDIQAELGRIASDVTVVDARAARDAERLAATSSAKDAQGLEHEIASLARRKSELEDAQLAAMERLEAAEAAVAAQQALIADVNAEGGRLSADGKAAVAEAQTRRDAATRDRAAIAARVPGDLLARYESLAQRTPGAGLLSRRTCGGCNMELSGTDLKTIAQAAADEVVTCPQCGCILVRTDESGL